MQRRVAMTPRALASLEFWRELAEHGRRQSALRDEVFGYFSERGGYPIAHVRKDVSWSAVAEQLNETVIKQVIQHDLRVGERGRKRDPALLEELFRTVCRYIGQAPPILTLSEDVRVAEHVGGQLPLDAVRGLGASPWALRLAERQILMHQGETVRIFDPDLTQLQRQVLELLGVRNNAYFAAQ